MRNMSLGKPFPVLMSLNFTAPPAMSLFPRAGKIYLKLFHKHDFQNQKLAIFAYQPDKPLVSQLDE